MRMFSIHRVESWPATDCRGWDGETHFDCIGCLGFAVSQSLNGEFCTFLQLAFNFKSYQAAYCVYAIQNAFVREPHCQRPCQVQAKHKIPIECQRPSSAPKVPESLHFPSSRRYNMVEGTT